MSPRLWMVMFLSCLLSACASSPIDYKHIRGKMRYVDLSDGVTEREAITIAQNFIVNKGLGDRLYNLKPIGTEKKVVWDKNGERIELLKIPEKLNQPLEEYWFVYFRDKEGSQLFGLYPVTPFYVKVDAKTGEVMRWGLKNDEIR
jgi:hypothetical protein